MKKNSKKQIGSTKHEHPGRPKYAPKFPKRAEFTFIQFMETNDIETNPASKKYGKGPNCTMLTLRKFLTRDAKKLGRSELFRVRGVTAEPNSADGLGRRGYLYSVRAGVKAAKAPRKVKSAPVVKAAKAPKAPKAPADLSAATKTYEDIKAILAAPSPAIAPEVPASVTVPAVTIAPEPTPVEAPATSTLPVASLEPVTQ